MITIEIREEAQAEIREAFSWYEEKGHGLGYQFLVSSDAILERIGRHAKSFPVVEGGIRKAILRRFPYVLFFALERDRVVVIAVYHADPVDTGYGNRRLAGPLIAALLRGLSGWTPDSTIKVLARGQPVQARYANGYGYYPFVFRAQFVFNT